MSSEPSTFPDPIDISIPPGCGDDDVVAYLLATIGRPPTSARDQGWRETVSAYKRANLEYVAGAATRHPGKALPHLLVAPADLLITDQIRGSRLEHARTMVGRALFAAAVAAPEILVAMQELFGEPLADLPPHIRNHGTRQERIVRLLHAEDDADEVRQAEGIPQAPRRLPGSGPTTQIDVKNIQTRILQPAEPVLHLALGLKSCLDEIEEQLGKIHPDRASWEREGLGTATRREPGGRIVLRPRITERHLFELAGFFSKAVERAEGMYRLFAEDYIAAGRRSKFSPMIRLARG